MRVSVALAIVSAASAEAMRSGPGPDANPDDCQQTEALSADERQVCSRFHTMVDAAWRRNADAVLAYFNPDEFSAALAGQLFRSYDAWAPIYRRDLGTIDRIDRMIFPEVSVHTINADTILLLNTYDQAFTLTSGETLEVTGFGTQVWTRLDGQWRITHIAGQ